MSIQVQLSAKKVLVPSLCACCGVPMATEPLAVTLDEGFRVSHCTQCESHFKAKLSENSVMGIVIFFAGLAAPFWMGFPGVGLTLIGFVVFLVLQFRANKKARPQIEALRTPRCVAHDAKQYMSVVPKGGSLVQFTFQQDALGLAFVDLNREKVVNASHELLERAARARKQEVAAAPRANLPPPRHVDDEEEQVRLALEKIETAQGPAARRAALERALKGLQSEPLMQKLRVEASRIEVRAVLDKVDGLKTASAKRRLLVTALEEIQKDLVSDELQAQQIGWLKDALAELDKTEG